MTPPFFIDIRNCTDYWPVQRNRWLTEDDKWVNTTEQCPLLGDALPSASYTPSDPPIGQWDSLKDSYIAELNAWLKTASNIPGVPDTVDFTSTDPDELWDEIKTFLDSVQK